MSGVQMITVAEGDGDQRLDRWLRRLFPHVSQGRIEKMCRKGEIRVDGGRVKPATRLEAGQSVRIPPLPDEAAPQPFTRRETVSENDAKMMQGLVIYRDDHIIALNKPPGLPTQGGSKQTRHVDGLAEALKFGNEDKPRLVHRLDKDTSGVMVVAKSEVAHTGLVTRFQAHDMDRRYLALTRGAPRPLLGRIETRIDRDPSDRKRMAVVRESKRTASADWHEPDGDGYVEKGKHAITNYNTVETFGMLDEKSGLPAAALVECRLETGRTHQIRVHMAHIGAPVVGDPVYGKQRGLKAFGEGEDFREATTAARQFSRQALHAYILGFEHPVTGEDLFFEQDPPEDMNTLILKLRQM